MRSWIFLQEISANRFLGGNPWIPYLIPAADLASPGILTFLEEFSLLLSGVMLEGIQETQKFKD